MDDVVVTGVRIGTGVSVLHELAESGTNQWTAEGLWHVANNLAWSPPYSWAYNNGNNYNTGARNSGALVSPWVDLRRAEGARLTFRSWYET